MRLHRLQVTAFGPFSGSASVDFDALSDAGLFLIHGQTGAGKTSVLDAICFALYGQVPGARNAAGRGGLRSDHAPPDLGPQVVLEVTIRGRRFRITRTPAWERPKRRGTGTTTEQASVILEEFTGGAWTGLSTRLDEAGDLLGRLLGMNAAQFTQVALLPQGEFAQFLRAGAEERRRVLEKLFATEVFTQVERWLADHRAATGRTADELRAATESVADRIAETTGTDRPDLTALFGPADLITHPPISGDGGAGGVYTAWAVGLAGEMAAVAASARELAGETAARVAAVRPALERGRRVAELRARHAEAVRRREALRERARERAELAARLEAAARADRVVPLIRAVRERELRFERAAGRAAQGRAAVAELVPGESPDDVLAKAERDRRDEVAGLDRLHTEAVRLRELTGELRSLDQRLALLDAQEAELGAALVELPVRVAELQDQLAQVRARVAGRDGAVTVAEDAAQRVDSARRRDALAAGLEAAEAAHRQAVDTAQEARDLFQELRGLRLEGMATRLADELEDGRPCLVCGSTEHPAPAASLGIIPSDADERQAEAVLERAQAEREQAATRVAELRAELDAVRERAADRPVDALEAELLAAEAELDAIDQAAATAEPLAAALQAADADLAQARDRREAAVQALAEIRTRRAEAVAEAERLTERLDQARGTDPTLEARIDRLTKEADRLARATDLLREAETAQTDLAQARTDALHAATAEGFTSAPREAPGADLCPVPGQPTAEGFTGAPRTGPRACAEDGRGFAGGLEAAARAALGDEVRRELQGRVKRYDDEEAAVAELLADPELSAAAAQDVPDLAGLRAALDEAEEAHAAVSAALERAVRRCARLAELIDELARREADWRPAAARHAVAARLAGLVTGQSSHNRLSMRLSAYVLAARLEQVVAAANERLATMSAGRYALVHTLDKAAGDRRGGSGGLGLKVADAWTGRERDPVTLSGGESFISSLALALGLADVVTQEAGGAEIGTLFVDEGFGTLDEQTLDEVMDVLDGLRDGGRAVGIVSHVAELRGRIPAQLKVRKDRTGSTVEVTV